MSPINTRAAEARIAKARANLLLDQPFFGALALRLIPEPAPWLKSGGMAVDGRRLYYHPEFVADAPADELKAGIAQGVMHCALGHPFRRGARDQRTWNDAGDHVINLALQDAGMTLPKDWLASPTFAGMSTEQVYAAFYRDQDGSGGDNGADAGQSPDGRPAPGHGGGAGVMDPQAPAGGGADGSQGPTAQDLRDLEREWQEAIAQAEFTSTCRGHTPGGSIERIRDARRPKADWRALLREWLTAMARDQYTWSRPNRRHIGDGLYLPSVYSESCPPLVLAIDTSGSITSEMLAQFAGELNAILEDVRPERVTVIYCDARVNHVVEFTPDELPIALEAYGRGGTAFDPVFAWVRDNLTDPIAGLVYLTDMYGGQVPAELAPDYPVLWADYGRGEARYDQPFGERVSIAA